MGRPTYIYKLFSQYSFPHCLENNCDFILNEVSRSVFNNVHKNKLVRRKFAHIKYGSKVMTSVLVTVTNVSGQRPIQLEIED